MEEKLQEFYDWLYQTLENYDGSPEEQSAVRHVINKFEEMNLVQ